MPLNNAFNIMISNLLALQREIQPPLMCGAHLGKCLHAAIECVLNLIGIIDPHPIEKTGCAETLPARVASSVQLK
uniref:Uncharacterized protein n=1 Tax=Anguilla anguilla TaxID=7936 RepID=A0A0E9RE93_ANGAN